MKKKKRKKRKRGRSEIKGHTQYTLWLPLMQ